MSKFIFDRIEIVPSGGAPPVTEWDNQDKAFSAIAQRIRKAVEELQQHKSSPSRGK